MHKLLTALVTLLFALGANSENTNPTVFESGPAQVTLLELYTSEGCSSCPPADAWLANLADHPDLWQRFVPLAFHVDYWNYLGWQDVWSKPRHSNRQRKYKAEGGIKSVYTPGFVANGEEWRGWFQRQRLPDSPGRNAGRLQVSITDGALKASFDAEQYQQRKLELNVALLGFDIETSVAAGENRGKTLRHQFVVMGQEKAKSKNGQWSLRVPSVENPVARKALAVWVSLPGEQKPLQSVGGWLP